MEDADRDTERRILEGANRILEALEADERAMAMDCWDALSKEIDPLRRDLSAEAFGLLIQLEFYMEGHPATDAGDLLNARYQLQEKLRRG